MNQLECYGDVLRLAKADMPQRLTSDPVFQAPWQARIFALVVAAVKNGHVAWPTFQRRLVAELKRDMPHGAPRSADEIEHHYFDCWLDAAEQTLVAEGFVAFGDVIDRIAAIRQSVEQIREHQLSSR